MSSDRSRGSPRPRVSTIAKVGDLVALFTTERPGWRLNELARELGWDAATTHRLVNALVDIRLLDRRGEQDAVYRLGTLALELSSVYLSVHPLRREVVEEMQSLAEQSELTAQIGVLANAGVSIVDSRESLSPLRAAAQLGQRLPLHATAAGKVILAQLPHEQAADLLPARMEGLTERTITDREALFEQLDEVRTTGIAYAEGELADGLCAAAVPVPAGAYSMDLTALTCAGPPRSIAAGSWEVAEARLRTVATRLSARRDGHGPVAR